MNKTQVLINNGQINGRTIDPDVLLEMIKKYNEEPFRLGELGSQSSNVISLKNVSHEIKNVRLDGNCVLGDIEILDTPSGKKLAEIYDIGKICPRIVGTILDGKITDFTIISFDIGL